MIDEAFTEDAVINDDATRKYMTATYKTPVFIDTLSILSATTIKTAITIDAKRAVKGSGRFERKSGDVHTGKWRPFSRSLVSLYVHYLFGGHCSLMRDVSQLERIIVTRLP